MYSKSVSFNLQSPRGMIAILVGALLLLAQQRLGHVVLWGLLLVIAFAARMTHAEDPLDWARLGAWMLGIAGFFAGGNSFPTPVNDLATGAWQGALAAGILGAFSLAALGALLGYGMRQALQQIEKAGFFCW